MYSVRALINKCRTAMLAGGRWQSQSYDEEKISLEPACLLNKHCLWLSALIFSRTIESADGAGITVPLKQGFHIPEGGVGCLSEAGAQAVLPGLSFLLETTFWRGADSQSTAQQTEEYFGCTPQGKRRMWYKARVLIWCNKDSSYYPAEFGCNLMWCRSISPPVYWWTGTRRTLYSHYW